jgi:glycosyltransferase involved in cell wall biosynthesis
VIWEEYAYGFERRKMKTQKSSLSIVMYCDGMPFDGDTLRTRSLGGTETAALQTACELTNQGHKVVMVNNTERPGSYDGVEYRNGSEFGRSFLQEKHDVSLVLRHPELFRQRHNSKVNILWQHDLAFVNEKTRFLDSTWNIDSVWTQSPFHKGQYQGVMGLSEDYYWVAGSAIDPELIPGEGTVPRDPKKLVYTGRPERGLEALLIGIMPRMLEEDPELVLHIATYDNFPPHILELIRKLKKIAEPFKDNVRWLPSLTKRGLYDLFSSAALYLYPVTHHDPMIGNFEETYCLSVDEAMACGLPFVSRPLGAIPDTLHSDAGLLVDGFDSNMSPDFYDAFASEALRLLGDNSRWSVMSEAGRRVALEEDTWKVRVKGFVNKIHNIMDSLDKSTILEMPEGTGRSDIFQSLSVGVLVRPGDVPHVARCLASVQELTDKIVVAFPEGMEGLSISGPIQEPIIAYHLDDFHRDQAELWPEILTHLEGEWLLWLYGSEEIQNPGAILGYLRHNPFDGYAVNRRKASGDKGYMWDDMLDGPARFIRRSKLKGFHGEVFPRPVIEDYSHVWTLPDVEIMDFSGPMEFLHYQDRIRPVLEGDNSVANRDFYRMRSDLVAAVHEMSLNGKLMTDRIRQRLDGIRDYYRRNFRGDLTDMGLEAVRIYSQVNQMLGDGFDMKMDLDVSRNGNPERSSFQIRFDTRTEADIFLEAILDQRIAPITDKYYLTR